MIRPVAFRMNEETAVNNYFQEDIDLKNSEINTKAQEEFDAFVAKLRAVGVRVIVEHDDLKMDTPDSIFPNNWVSFHENGVVALYPMFAVNRRRERREEVMDRLESEGFIIDAYMDYTSAEEEELFLEGTGSLLLDRVHKKAYCALSPRADEELLIEFCEDFDYFPVVFTANQTVDGQRMPIYHTNVMMALGENFAIICLDTIDDKAEKKNVVHHLQEDGKEIITITEAQMHRFAGNMLQVRGTNDSKYLVMSLAAHKSLTSDQVEAIEKHCEILSSDLETIETCGGGSARCMMAEVFLPEEK
ncbi:MULTISPECIES: citrulline utilization hydrolase CtlX [Altibacter]|uniref:citrulline utilization hydrolase CtlX n=1 Tax=Altibacter TaxID=1535231 RepID=UPI000556CC4E|nr:MULTISPECIES: arginine deiminase-related protein [Altibacter]MCW8981279.1 arginine deiminase-related protein [Altibacter sp.]MCW9038840.1 arginine deiminase-related protein [Altibacter sp.]